MKFLKNEQVGPIKSTVESFFDSGTVKHSQQYMIPSLDQWITEYDRKFLLGDDEQPVKDVDKQELRPTQEVSKEIQEIVALKIKEKYPDGVSKEDEQKIKERIQ